MTNTPDITIPESMRPGDGRFGSGPSKVRSEAVAALAREADDYLGTSHRRDGVRFVVAALRNGLLEMFDAPDGYDKEEITHESDAMATDMAPQPAECEVHAWVYIPIVDPA